MTPLATNMRLDDVELVRGYFEQMASSYDVAFHPELARGPSEQIVPDRDALLVRGWLLRPDKPFTALSVWLNGKPACTPFSMTREDLGQVFPWVPHARRSGFQFVGDLQAERIDVIGYHGNLPLGRLTTLFRADALNVSVPPSKLMERVTGVQSPEFFRIDGMKSFSDFIFAIRRHRDLNTIRRMLDWGCGCGRVTMHFLLDGTIREVYGCDIDHEAIAWCCDNLKTAGFLHIDPWPPTPYNDETFDLVIGYSVFTHLGPDAQKAWLAEIRRIIAPGGLFLATTHGEFAALFAFPPRYEPARGPLRWIEQRLLGRRPPEILREGIFAERRDSALDGIAPEDYYRGVFQTRDYTIREWSKHFEILEYIERGAGNYQDLVVMRRPVERSAVLHVDMSRL